MNKDIRPLKEILDEKDADFELNASAEAKAVYTEGIEATRRSGVLEKAKNIGDEAVNFTLRNALGNEVSLNDYLAKGPVVLTWYRGGWCPYCNMTLHRLQEELPNFKALGASLLALSPELPDRSLSTQEKHNLEFDVLSDVGNTVARLYGLVIKLTEAVATQYQNSFDLHAHNGDESHELPITATYVIDKTGIIKYAYLDAVYRKRAEPAEILNILKELR